MGPQVDSEKCAGCSTCIGVCSAQLVVFEMDDDNKSRVIHPAACVECGSCVENCPQEAITLVE